MTSPDESTTTPQPAAKPPAAAARRVVLSQLRHNLRTPLNAILGYGEMLVEDATQQDNQSMLANLQAVITLGRNLLELINEIVDIDKLEVQNAASARVFDALLRDLMRPPLVQLTAYVQALIDCAGDAQNDDYTTDLQKIYAATNRLRDVVEEVDTENPANAASPHAILAAATEDSNPVSVNPISVAQSALPAQSAASERSPVVSTVAADQKPAHVLVVDDNEANRDVLSQRLLRQGLQVTTAGDGLQALELLSAHAIDLVLLDLIMPGLDGYDVLQRLKHDERWRHIPVIMISALDEIESVARCIESGADDYLTKPFNPVLLQARIGACLEKKQLRDSEIRLHRDLEDNFQRLQAVESMRDNLTHMIVHDLRTPLTSFISGLSLVEGVGPINDIQRECLHTALRGGDTLLGMINDLLDVSKQEAGSLELELVPLRVDDLVGSALTQVSGLFEMHNHELSIDIEPELPLLHGDEDKLQRALVNLLGNASKFTPPKGHITVRVWIFDQRVQFAVSDSGPGIAAESFVHIFEKFGQTATRSAGHKMSSGLGLTFCKMVAEAHGGVIRVESELGHGSTFTLAIPLTEIAP